MQFDLKNFLQNAKTAYKTQFSVTFSEDEFGDFRVLQPAECTFTAEPTEEGAAMSLYVQAQVEGECARCLAPVTESYDFTRGVSGADARTRTTRILNCLWMPKDAWMYGNLCIRN